MVRVCANVRRHRLVALQTRCVRIHLRFQLGVVRPFFQTGLTGGIEMHFVAGNAEDSSARKPGGRCTALSSLPVTRNITAPQKRLPKKTGPVRPDKTFPSV